MATDNTTEQYRPHFVIDPGADERTIMALQSLEDAIYTDASSVGDAVDRLAVRDHTGNPEFDEVISMAVSKEVGLEFDEVTEESIVRSATMKLLREKRKGNQHNDEKSQELAAEVRRVRLRLFVERVMQHKLNEILSGDILPIQEQAGTPGTATNIPA